MADRSEFALHMDGIQQPPSPFGDSVSATRRIDKVLTVGTGNDQMNVLLAVDTSIPALGSISIDLTADLDRFGVAAALDDVAIVYVENKSDSLSDSVEVRPGAANAFTNMLGTGSVVKLPIGGFVLVGNFTADKYDVTGTNKTLAVHNTHATLAADVRYYVWGRR